MTVKLVQYSSLVLQALGEERTESLLVTADIWQWKLIDFSLQNREIYIYTQSENERLMFFLKRLSLLLHLLLT